MLAICVQSYVLFGPKFFLVKFFRSKCLFFKLLGRGHYWSIIGVSVAVDLLQVVKLLLFFLDGLHWFGVLEAWRLMLLKLRLAATHFYFSINRLFFYKWKHLVTAIYKYVSIFYCRFAHIVIQASKNRLKLSFDCYHQPINNILMISQKDPLRRAPIQLQKFYSSSIGDMECDETLGQPQSFNYNLPHKNICCKCKNKDEEHSQCSDPLERKRQKRKQYKKRLKVRQREEKQNAYKELEIIIDEIYKLLDSFEEAKADIVKCIELVENDTDRFYDFINFIIKEQVDAIRKEIKFYLEKIPTEPDNEDFVRELFNRFQRIQLASPEIQKIINLFIVKTAESTKEIIPYQKNLDKMTFRFIIKNDLENNKSFGLICQKMFNQLEKYERQKHIFQAMLDIRNNQSSEDEDQYEEDQTSSSEQNSIAEDFANTKYEKQRSHSQRSKGNPEYSELSEQQYWCNKENQLQSSNQKEDKKSRPKKKKKSLQQFDSSFETINNRLRGLAIKNQQRTPCNVSQQWKEKMKKRAEKLKKDSLISQNQRI